MMDNVDIVDISIAAVGVAMLPLLPDLLANLMVAFLPNAWATARVRAFSSSVRRVTNTVVSRVLVVGSLVIPVLALYFQLPMLEFKGVRALSRGWWIEVGSVCACVVRACAALGVRPARINAECGPNVPARQTYPVPACMPSCECVDTGPASFLRVKPCL
jgi:hypothetical protein